MFLRRNRQAGLVFILITLFLDILGLGIIIPVLPHLVTDMVGGDASEASVWYGILVSCFAVTQFIFAPALGALSDRFGRRPVLLISLFGFGVNYLLLALAPTLAWLFVARVFCGITGASLTTANAYVADISTPKNRSQNFGMVGAAFGLGFIFGPAFGGLLGSLGPRAPFYAAAAIVLVNWLYGLLVLPESLPAEKRRSVSIWEANPFGGFKLLKSYPLVAWLSLAVFFSAMAHRSLETIWVLYAQYRYGWGELENGLTLALVGLMVAFVQGYLIRRIVPSVGERRSLLVGLTISVVGFSLYGLASSPWMFLSVIVFASLGAVAGPVLQGLVAGVVRPTEQGGVQGALASLMSLTAIFAPLISTQVFAACTGPEAIVELPGAPFFVGSGFLLIALLIVVAAFRTVLTDGSHDAGQPEQGGTSLPRVSPEPST